MSRKTIRSGAFLLATTWALALWLPGPGPLWPPLVVLVVILLTRQALVGLLAGAILGVVFGDHCSPFSDTTIVTPLSCSVTPHDHVRTQLPYALLTAAVAAVFGFLPAGFGWPVWVLLILGSGMILLLPRLWVMKASLG